MVKRAPLWEDATRPAPVNVRVCVCVVGEHEGEHSVSSYMLRSASSINSRPLPARAMSFTSCVGSADDRAFLAAGSDDMVRKQKVWLFTAKIIREIMQTLILLGGLATATAVQLKNLTVYRVTPQNVTQSGRCTHFFYSSRFSCHLCSCSNTKRTNATLPGNCSIKPEHGRCSRRHFLLVVSYMVVGGFQQIELFSAASRSNLAWHAALP